MPRPFPFYVALKVSEPHAGEAHGSGTGRGQWTDIGDDSLAPYGNSYDDSHFGTHRM